MKRLCLLAGYHKHGLIADYVLHYAKSMSLLADVYYMADCDMHKAELDKLAPYVKGAFAYRHKKYDFGSWQELILKLGWDTVSSYDEVILCNDSCFGPLHPLGEFFKAAQQEDCSLWGMTAGSMNQPHIQTYFLVLRQEVVRSVLFQQFIHHIEQKPKHDLVWQYETQLSALLQKGGFTAKVFFNLTETGPDFEWQTMIKNGFPFLKIRSIADKNCYTQVQPLTHLRTFMAKHTLYPSDYIFNHLENIGVDTAFWQTGAYKKMALLERLRAAQRWLLRVHLQKRVQILRVLGLYLWYKDPDTRFATFKPGPWVKTNMLK